jgi:cytochrome b
MSDVKEVKPATRIVVWDPVVRYGHWLLVAAFAVAYVTAEEEGGGSELLHVWAGYVVGVIVGLRVLWGFIGPQPARFRDFLYGPVAPVRYFFDLLRGRARRYLGHSPAGGAMVVLLLLSLAGTVGTGLEAYGERGKGPLADTGPPLVAAAYADDAKGGSRRDLEMRREGGDAESVVGELHSALANITLALVILQVIGVGLASVVHRENLVLAMINGRKRADQ